MADLMPLSSPGYISNTTLIMGKNAFFSIPAVLPLVAKQIKPALT